MQSFFTILVAVGIAGGVGVVAVTLTSIIYDIYKHFTWEKVKLSDQEIKELNKAHAEKNPLWKSISKIAEDRSVNWKTAEFNRITGELKVR